jgi:hypothetical protein
MNDVNTFVHAAWSGDVEKMVAAFARGWGENGRRLRATVRDVNVLGTVHGEGTAMLFASWNGKLDAVRWLLAQEGIDVDRGNANGASPLHVASANGHEAVVGALITAGADVNHQNRWGFTALMAASSNGHTTIARRLIAAGARVNHADSRGWTALDVRRSHFHAIHVKRRHPPDYRRADPVEVLLLVHRAMPGGHWPTLPPLHTRLLRPTDAPFTLSPEEALPGVLSKTDVFGRTALHYAALTGNRAAYAVLYSAMREAGVDTEGVDGGDYTAMDHLVCACVSTTDNFFTSPTPTGLYTLDTPPRHPARANGYRTGPLGKGKLGFRRTRCD